MVSVVRFFLHISLKWNTLNKKTIKIFHPLCIIFLSLIAYNVVPDKIPDKKDYQRKTMKISIFDIFFDIN